ncbi:hypothetical protein [Neobacillus sp. D3-1R]|uniref:hypothetical protein n=1 Tax=Neobacillus sp. D3-1R TaxID=3445778 RepID=UPI003F9F874C
MNNPIHNSHLEQKSFHDFYALYEGMKQKGIYLLEYHDSYLKDAFVTQLTERFISKGSQALLIQKEQPSYTLNDLYLSRTLFRYNPHEFFSISEVGQGTFDFLPSLPPSFQLEINAFMTNTEIITLPSHQPHDCLDLISRKLEQNPGIKFVIWESHTDYFYSSNLIPRLSRLSFKYGIPSLITSKISTEKFTNRYPFLPAFLQSSFYVHSKYPNLFSLSNSKEMAYQFELEIKTASNKQKKQFYTLRPASGYCQEG